MVNIFRSLMVFLLLSCAALGEAAEVEFTRTATFDIAGSPVDVTVSPDGKSIYVLSEAGDIFLYSSSGQLTGKLHVGGQIDFLTTGPSENQLYIGSTGAQTLQAISLEFVYEIDISGAPSQGVADAPVVIAVFMDYQCPYCARLIPVLEDVLEINAGRVKVVYKQYPLKMHAAALSAAAAALAAFRGGKFKELHTLMWESYQSLDEKKILDKAVDIGFDRDSFQKEMTDLDLFRQVQKDIEDGKKADVSGIPSVFVNGRRLKIRTLEGFQELIDRELQKFRTAEADGGL